MKAASPTCVLLRSSNRVRTSPVRALATRNQAVLWSRELETKATCEPSGYHCTSQMVPPLHCTWSDTVERCASAGMFSRTTCGRPSGPMPMITRWMRKITLSPGSGYFHASSRGSPTLVDTRYMSEVPRASC